jgi:hypothetical protein
MMTARLFSTASVMALLGVGPLLAAVSCAEDPVHDQQVFALGGEDPNIPPGPYHRAGQPCTVCHGPQGPATTQFSLAGTIFEKNSLLGVENAEILLVDAYGTNPPNVPLTNCVGNFYITPDVWNPAFPLSVGVAAGGMKMPMMTQISRASSCAECHNLPSGFASPGVVYINVSVNPKEHSKCPVQGPAGGEAGIP